MPKGKHSPNRFGNYFRVHDTRMHQYVLQGVILEDTLELTTLSDAFLMEGVLPCLGGIEIEVRKKLQKRDEGPDPLIQTVVYSYNVSLRGVGVIFRYDSPHPTDGPEHHPHHHKHTYNLLQGDTEGRVEIIYDEEEVPTLSEVIEEARDWYHENAEELRRRGLV